MEEEVKKQEEGTECLVIIVNSGFTDLVMDAARKEGARGGTIFHAKGTGSPDNEKFFGISITPDKEIVLILCKKTDSEKILLRVNQTVGLATPGLGIGFSLPVSDTIGVKFNNFTEKKEEESSIKSAENPVESVENSPENSPSDLPEEKK